jgi:lipopolysaccharide export system permease protein
MSAMNIFFARINFFARIKILDLYIIKELIGPFIFGMLGFMVVISIDPMIYAMKNIINSSERGVEAVAVLKWFCYSLATDMIFTFPMATLLATLIVFGRLSKDSELTAMKAGGLSFTRLCYPVMWFAMFATVTAFLFGEFVVPHAVKRSQMIKRTQILKLLPIMGQENIYLKDSPDRTIYVERADNVNNILTNIIISNYDHDTGLLKTRVMAKTARHIDGGWVFSDGVLYDFDKEGNGNKIEEFAQKKIFINQKPKDFKRDEQTHQEMSMRDLAVKIRYAYDHGLSDVVGLLVEFYLKTSIPFSCFIFALIGAALGTSNTRAGGFISFGISMLIIFIYYVIFSIARSFGKNGMLSPVMAAWIQNIIFLAAGLLLIKRVRN